MHGCNITETGKAILYHFIHEAGSSQRPDNPIIMLTENIKQEIRDKMSAISAAIPGFRSRPAQRVMIAEVAKTLARCPSPSSQAEKPAPGKTTLVVQGGTGTGKSLGYSLSGMALAAHRGKKLVISSSTIALQEQLTLRDLPLFTRAAGMDVSVELAKGRTRYVCRYRLEQALEGVQQISMFSREQMSETDEDGDALREQIAAMARDLSEGRWNGDRDARSDVSDKTWKTVTTDRHGCLNRACPFFHDCAQMAARKRLRKAQVIVVNHDLLLADLAMGGGLILPSPADCFYVIDEAHNFPEKAVASFASNHMIHAARRASERIGTLSGALLEALGATYAPVCEKIRDEAARLHEDLSEAHAFMASLSQLRPTRERPRPTLEFADSCIPEAFFGIGENIRALTDNLIRLMSACQDDLGALLVSDRSRQALYEKVLADLGFLLGRLEEIHQTWTLFLEEPAENAPPVAKWVETVPHKRGVDFQINASPVFAGEYLRKLFWDKAAGVVLTSATLTTLGNFDNFLYRTGLTGYGVNCIDLPSAFDYANQGVIEIPKMPNPKNYDAHTLALTGRLVADMGKQGAEGMLVIFTSRRQMLDVAERLPEALRARVLIQGTQPKSALIQAHRQAVDNGRASTIFGLASFTEGVDLPAAYCTEVVIARLPFTVPDSPVLRTLSSWVQERGGNPFMEISVPDAARRLEQSVGRLIRTETDRGQVVVADPRLWDSRFGRAILRGLPPFRIAAMGKEVRV